MAKPTTDESIFRKIEGLVHEEQHLYGKSELADHDQVRLDGEEYLIMKEEDVLAVIEGHTKKKLAAIKGKTKKKKAK